MTAFLKPRPSGGYYVGFERGDYRGPEAEVYTISYPKDAEPTWVVVCTDDYEGHAMLNIETLPKLRQALSKLAAELKCTKALGNGSATDE